MATYGIDFLGTALYGEPLAVNFSVQPFRADTLAYYGRVNLSWSKPSGGWDRFRLLRSFYGFPTFETGGDVLVDYEGTDPPTTYVDTDVEAGKFVYYAILLRLTGTNSWRVAGTSFALPIQDHAYSTRLYDLVPMHLREADTQTQLERFLSVFGVGFDLVRTEYETLRRLYDIDHVSAGLLGVLAQQFGVSIEPALGTIQLRRLLRDAVHLYKTKGTQPGVEGIVSAYTGWGANASVGKNLLLSDEPSHLVVTNGSVTRDVAPDDPDTETIKFTSNAGGTAELRTAAAASAKTWGIPVAASTAYAFSLSTWAVTTARAVALEIEWYDVSGTYLSSATVGGSTNTVGSWTQKTLTATSPAGAVYAVLSWTIGGTPANGEVHHIKHVQFEQSASVTAFESARLIILDLEADRVNLVPNPSLETNTTGWSVSGGTATRNTSFAWTDAGSASYEVTVSGPTCTVTVE